MRKYFCLKLDTFLESRVNDLLSGQILASVENVFEFLKEGEQKRIWSQNELSFMIHELSRAKDYAQQLEELKATRDLDDGPHVE